MISDFLGDHNSHLRMRMLVEAGRPLQRESQNALAKHQDGQHSMCVWQAERSLLRAAKGYGLYNVCLCALFVMVMEMFAWCRGLY